MATPQRFFLTLRIFAYVFWAVGLLALVSNGFRYYRLHQAYRQAKATIVSVQPNVVRKDGEAVYVGDLGVVYQLDGQKTAATARVVAPVKDVSPAAFSLGRVINIIAPLDPGKVQWAGDEGWLISPEYDGRTGMRVGAIFLVIGLLLTLIVHHAPRWTAAPSADETALDA